MPDGWNFKIGHSNVSRVAEIYLDYKGRSGRINLDKSLFESPDIPEGCKVFMLFHEFGHAIHGPREELCDEFAFWNALAVGVSPFLCFVALKAFMPQHYDYRVIRLANIMKANPYLIKLSDGSGSTD